MITTISDAIAIKILYHKNNNAILKGNGNEIHLYKSQFLSKETNIYTGFYKNSEKNTKLPMTLREKVHGIESGKHITSNEVLVFGGREFMLLTYTEPDYKFRLVQKCKVTDWINAAAFMSDAKEFVVHTAHSVLLRFVYCLGDNCKFKIVEKISCMDKSTLYCAHLHGSNWQNLIVFGGNAFGELLVWHPSTANEKTKKLSVLNSIPAHKGVIFSIDYNPRYQLLITTSDDRSVKFWRVENLIPHSWTKAQIKPLVSCFGHTARVFRGKLIEKDSYIYAVTVSEDSYFCLWRIDGTCVFKRREHFGAIIWNLAYEKESQTLFTVSSTGNISAYGLQDYLTVSKNPYDSAVALIELNKTIGECIAKIKFINADLLIGISNKNRLLYTQLNSSSIKEQHFEWYEIEQFYNFQCTVMEVHENLIALCGYRRVTLYEYKSNTNQHAFQKLGDTELMDGVIRSFHFLNKTNYLISDECGQCYMACGKELLIRTKIELPICKERWITSALLVQGHDDKIFLLASNRQGNLLLFQRTQNNDYELKKKLNQIHGFFGITDMKVFQVLKTQIFIKSCGRDGTIKLLCLNSKDSSLHIYKQENVPVAWIEVLHEGNLILGFNDNRFVAWTREDDFLWQFACGGGHRCWHYCVESKGRNYLNLVFIKRKKVLVQKLKLYNEHHSNIMFPALNKWHVKNCNVMSVIWPSKQGVRLIASAGDDNLVIISTIDKHNKLVYRCTIYTHISNVRSMKLWHENQRECFIFTGGGRGQVCISKIFLKSYRVQQLCNHTLECAYENTDKCGKNRRYKINAETRIMSIDVETVVTEQNKSIFHVYLACSNGFLHHINWTESEKPIYMNKLYLQRCLLKVRIILNYVLIASTNGFVYFYSKDLKKEYFKLRLHQSAVNTFDVLIRELNNGTKCLHIISGGDDQEVVNANIVLKGTEELCLLDIKKFRNLHTAQVTAVALCWTNCELYALSSGLDENFCILNLSKERIVRIFRTCISDIKGLCVDTELRCYIYGWGLQVLNSKRLLENC